MELRLAIIGLCFALLLSGCAAPPPSDQPAGQPPLPPGEKAYRLPNGTVQVINVSAIQNAAQTNDTKMLLAVQGKISAGNYDAAIADCGLLLQSSQDMVPAYVYRAEAKYRKGMFNESIADLDAARALEKSVPPFEKFKAVWEGKQ